MDRIREASLLRESYEIPPGFDHRVYFKNSWGIWSSDVTPAEVVLRFTAQTAARVRETQWHRNQEIEPLDDGRLIWKARIDEPKEMLPWIRGWGSDVELLAPLDLRETVRKEAEKTAALYGQG